MVNTVKFSEFNAITLNGANSLVGLSNGDNAISSLPISWTTSGRPVAPTNGFSGYNTSLSQWEFWNAGISTWEPVGGGGAGTVTQVDTGTGLTGGPITSSGTISFAAIAANSLWANNTGGSAVPNVIPLSTFLFSANNLSDLPNKATARSNLGVAIGTNVEAWSAILDQIAAGTWLGAASITTLGTITTGIWNGSTVTVPFGGTGNTTFTAYSVLCAGTTATGPFQNVSGLGSAGQVLTSNGAGGLPTWQNTSGSGTVNPGLINQVAYYAAAGTVVSGLATGNNGVLITSGGGVPSISSTLPTLVQTNITELGTINTGVWQGTNVDLAHGGTNASLTASNGGIFYSTATAGAILLGTVTANQILMSGSSSAPAWSTATYPATTTINQILYSSAANTISGLATLANGTLITSGAGIPSISTTLPSTVQLNITQLGTITTGIWNGTTIAVANGGTGNTTFTSYSVLCAGTTATGPFQNVSGVGLAGQVLTSNGAAALPTWQNIGGTGTVNSGTANDLAYYATTGNAVSGLASANGGVLVTSNTGVPSILAGSGTTGTVLQATSGGTPAWSTATYPATTTINQILFSSSANVVAGITTANNGTLITSGGGVPSISSTLPTAVQGNITQLGTQSQALNMGSNLINNVSDPVSAQDAATKNYVDNIAAGGAAPVVAATTGALNATYSNGVAGVGATLTNAGAQTTFTIDGQSPSVTQRVLIKNQASTFQNGIYTVTNVGSGATNWILTRATDYDTVTNINDTGVIPVLNGTVNSNTGWVNTTIMVAVGTTGITYVQFGASYPISLANGGTGASLVASNGGIFYSSASAGAILAGTATANQVLLSGSSTTPAWSTATYPATTTINRILYSSAADVIGQITSANSGVLVTSSSGVPSILAAGTTGQVLQASSAGTPAWSTAVYPATTTTSQILYSSATNNVAGIVTQNNGMLVTDSSGVPSILAGPGVTGKMLLSNSAAAPSFSTSTIPSSAGATANKVLLSDGTNYALSTPTFPNASATTNKVIKSDGTNWVASTETYAAPGSSGNVLTSDGTNWTSAAPAATAQNPFIASYRLTLTSGLPVTTADVTAATSFFTTPYEGNEIALFDGSSTWTTLTFSEITTSVPASTSTMYDVFAFNNSGSVNIETLAWTNDTTRATALVLQNGVYVKSGATTRRYLGSIRTTTVSGQTEDSLAKRYVWNYTNRVTRPMKAIDSTDTWTYSTATYRQANGSTANQLDMVIGVSEDEVTATVTHRCVNSTATIRGVCAGIGLDVTNATSATIFQSKAITNVQSEGMFAFYNGFPSAGRHFLAWLEIGAGADTQTWSGDNGTPTTVQSGISGFLRG